MARRPTWLPNLLPPYCGTRSLAERDFVLAPLADLAAGSTDAQQAGVAGRLGGAVRGWAASGGEARVGAQHDIMTRPVTPYPTDIMTPCHIP